VTRTFKAVLIAAIWVFPACAVGPKYQRPDTATPKEFRFVVGPQEAASIADLPWWEMYKDPILLGLLREALENNQDLRSAAARVAEASSLVGVARADFFPTVGLQAEGPYGQQQAKNYRPGVGPSGSLNVSLGISWELDIWGRVRNSNDAAKAQLLATEEGRRAVILTLVSNVAQTYSELMELDVELEIARRTTVTRQGTLDLFTKRSLGGVGNDLEVTQGRAELAVTSAAIPATERMIALKESKMSVLLGRSPGPIARALSTSDDVPLVLPMGVPASLLERRPDVRAAEDQVMASTSSVGVAIANRLPKLSLEGIIGLAGPTFPATFSGNGLNWGVGGGLMAPIFQGGRLSMQEQAAKDRLAGAVAQYRQTVLTAWHEVSDAAISVRKLHEIAAQQSIQVTSALTAERLARLRYEGGVSAYLDVLDAQRSSFNAELSLAQTMSDERVAMIQLYQALGGGWQDLVPVPQKKK
jgi:multidrug efflux system outer membrane protein